MKVVLLSSLLLVSLAACKDREGASTALASPAQTQNEAVILAQVIQSNTFTSLENLVKNAGASRVRTQTYLNVSDRKFASYGQTNNYDYIYIGSAGETYTITVAIGSSPNSCSQEPCGAPLPPFATDVALRVKTTAVPPP